MGDIRGDTRSLDYSSCIYTLIFEAKYAGVHFCLRRFVAIRSCKSSCKPHLGVLLGPALCSSIAKAAGKGLHM